MDNELTSTQNEHYSNYPPSTNAWIYIAIDIRDMSISKIGLTTKEAPQQRINEGKTYNPYLSLFTVYELSKCSWGTSKKELSDIESYIHTRSILGAPIKYLYTAGNSEWFKIRPWEAESQIDWILAKRGFSVNGRPLYTDYISVSELNGIDVEQMKKIKTIFRPDPNWFIQHISSLGMNENQFIHYINYLEYFHKEDNPYRVYLK